MVTYEKALQMWGRKRLIESHVGNQWSSHYGKDFDVDADTVSVRFYFDEGYNCCGG